MFFVERMGCHYKETTTFQISRPQGSGNFLLLLFLSDIYILHHSQMKLFPSGTVVLYSPTQPQFYHHPAAGFDNDWIHFVGEDILPFVSKIEFPIDEPFQIKHVGELHSRIQRIEQELLMKDKNSEYMVDTLMRELLLYLLKNISADSLNHSDFEGMKTSFQKARSTILSQLEYPWDIENMAKLLDLSPSRFSHCYRSIFRISPKKDLLTERMNMAKFLIQSQGYTVREVAAKVGYDNIYHFSKQFKLATGKSPSYYK